MFIRVTVFNWRMLSLMRRSRTQNLIKIFLIEMLLQFPSEMSRNAWNAIFRLKSSWEKRIFILKVCVELNSVHDTGKTSSSVNHSHLHHQLLYKNFDIASEYSRVKLYTLISSSSGEWKIHSALFALFGKFNDESWTCWSLSCLTKASKNLTKHLVPFVFVVFQVKTYLLFWDIWNELCIARENACDVILDESAFIGSS